MGLLYLNSDVTQAYPKEGTCINMTIMDSCHISHFGSHVKVV